MNIPGVTLMASAVYGSGAIAAQAASSGSDLESLVFQTGGVTMALAVGYWMIRRSDTRADAAAERAEKLLKDEREAHERTRDELVEEKARRLAAESQLARRDRDPESRRPSSGG